MTAHPGRPRRTRPRAARAGGKGSAHYPGAGGAPAGPPAARDEAPIGSLPGSRGIVLGLGNDILTDDAIGPLIVRRLKSQFQGVPTVEFIESNEMGLALLDFLEGYDWALLVDSMVSGAVPPATVRIFERSDFPTTRGSNPHHVGVYDALAFAERVDLAVPKEIRVVAIEVNDPFTFGTGLTPELERASDRLVAEVGELVRERLDGACTSTGSPERSQRL